MQNLFLHRALAYDYYPGGSIMPGRSYNSNQYRFGYNAGSEKDDEITGVTGSHFTTYFREFDTRILRPWSPDPVSQPWQSPYSYMDGNPVWFNDPLGDRIDSTITKGGGEDGRDLVTYTITGKMLNLSDQKDIDMDAALKDIKPYFEEVYSSKDVDGADYKFVFDFKVATSIDEIEEDDHALIIASGISYKDKKGDVHSAEGVAPRFGRFAYVTADYFTGWWDENHGFMRAYSSSHEAGHLFGLPHSGNPWNLMKAGTPWFSAHFINTVITDDQIRFINENYSYLNQNKYPIGTLEGGWRVKLTYTNQYGFKRNW